MDELLYQVKVILWKVMHFRWVAVAVTSVVLIIGWITVFLLPDQYEVKSTVYVDTQSVLKPLLKGLAVDDTVKEQAALLMRRTLLSRPNIEKVILQTDLDLTVDNDKQMERLILSLASGITVSGHGDKRRPDANIYRLTYSSADPQMTFRVVDALLDVFLESTLGMTRQDSSSASRFMSKQIQDYKNRLEAADETVKQFKIKHSGLLPSEKNTFFNRLETAKTQLQEALLIQKELEFKTNQLASQLGQVNKETNAANVAKMDRSGANRLADLETQLREYRLRFTDDHPDVIATLAAIEGLETQLKQNNAQNADDVMIENPVYQELSVLHGETKAELAVLNARVEEYRKRITDLNQQVEKIPQIEAEYTALVRDYNVISETYLQLVQRRESATISEEAERSGDTVQFRVIEPPTVPKAPVGPNRPLFLMAVLALGVGAGIGIAVLLAEIKGAIYSKTKLLETFSTPVLGEVSMTWNAAQIKSKRRDIFGLIGAVAAILTAFTTLMLYQFLVVGLPLG